MSVTAEDFCPACARPDVACSCTTSAPWEPGRSGVAQAGVDTWSPAWRIDPDSASGAWLDAAATVGSARGRLLPQAIGGHRVGWNRSAGMLYAEGHPGGDALGFPDELPVALERLVGELNAAGVPLPDGRAATDVYGDRFDGFLGVRRLDSTVDWWSKSGAEGAAVMAGCAALARSWPRSKSAMWAAKGRWETIALHGYGGGRMLGRIYDKGVESGVAPPGRLIRPENQQRFVQESRRAADELTSEWVAGKFKKRFAPLWRASKGVTVAGPIVIAERLREAVEAGEVTEAAAGALAGDLLMALAPPRTGKLLSPATRDRRRSMQRELGLVLADGVLQEVEVDLHDVLEEVMETDQWRRAQG